MSFGESHGCTVYQDHRAFDRVAEAPKVRRRVHWSELVEVEFIESRHVLGDKELLWYCKADFQTFKQEALMELRDFMLRNGIKVVNEGLALLYQPDHTSDTSS